MSVMVAQRSLFGGESAFFCRRCHRGLSNPKSIQAGMGPVCRGHNKNSNQEVEMDREFSDEYVNVPLTSMLFLGVGMNEHGNRLVKTNVPHLVIHHSPTGFEFGFGGSGPADLALNYCEWYLKHKGYKGERTQCWKGDCFSLAYVLHQDFKWNFIAGAPRDGGMISFEIIEAWFEENIIPDLKLLYGEV